jgi:hypothetical protein
VPAPVRRPISGATVTFPTTESMRRLRALPDHRWLDTLLRSRAWIWLLGIGLGGIVFMQVSLLKMNAGIGRAVESAATLERANAELQGEVAELSSGDRVRLLASGMGLVEPDAGTVGWLQVRPGVDGRRAARNMTPPTEQARQLLASGGRTSVVPTTTTTTVPTTATTTTPVATTAAPVATVAPAPAPVASATPAPESVAVSAPTGATAAPSGQG